MSSPVSYLVEREPMWDGNIAWRGGSRGYNKLSENQCGMETFIVRFRREVLALVEREPMWDGNLEANVLAPRVGQVEREPMWDGNSNLRY